MLLPELGRHIGSLGDTALKKKLARLRDLLMCPTDIARVEVGILLQVTDRLTLRGARYSAFTDCHVLLVLPTHMPSSAKLAALLWPPSRVDHVDVLILDLGVHAGSLLLRMQVRRSE